MAFEDAKVCSCDDNLLRSFKRNEMKMNSRSEHNVKCIWVFANIEVMKMQEWSAADGKDLAWASSSDSYDAFDVNSQFRMMPQQNGNVGEGS